jgi:hypothetical protein
MKVYVTKYALTSGIIETEARVCASVSGKMIETQGGYKQYFHKPDWYETKEEAVKRAELMRDKKIAALTKQIQKLQKMSFDKD